MRATEFIVEYKKYPTREYEGVTFTMAERDGQLVVKALNDFGLPMGHVVFNMDGKLLDPQDLSVSSKYQGQGIARVMYDYIKSQGFTIERSYDQTDAGRGFWNKHRGEDARVWESVDAEFIIENIAGRNKSKIYNLLLSQIGSGPFDGGCVVMAQAIQAVYGGDIVVLVGHAQHDTNEVAQHAAVKIGNNLVDFSGAYEPHEFVRRFERNELAHAGGKITGIRPIQGGDLPDAPRDPAVSEIIARLLK